MMSNSGKKDKVDKFKLRVAGQPALEPPKPRPLPDEHPASLLFVGEKNEGHDVMAEKVEEAESPSLSTFEESSRETTPQIVQPQPLSPAINDERDERIIAPASPPEAKRSAARRTPSAKPTLTFNEFSERWSRLMISGERTGKLKICEVIFQQTYAVGRTIFFVSYGKLSQLCGLSKTVTKTNVKQLEEMGFLERLKTYNTATKKGSEYKLHLDPLRPEERREPSIIHYEE